MASATPFAGKVIAITGAASGIGLATAQYLAIRGASLSLADIQQKALESAAASIKAAAPTAKVLITAVDVRKAAEVREWISTTVNQLGKLSGAANLAGVIGKSIGLLGVTDLEDAEWDYIMDVNLKGVFHCLRSELKAIEDGGSIVNASSIAGVKGFSKNAAYSASKHGIVGLTRSAAKECSDSQVRINAICPGTIATPMVAKADSGQGEFSRPAIFKRMGDPEEVAALIAFLLGDESRFTTGAAYSIDGGWNC